MPNDERPPGYWLEETVKTLSKAPGITDPQALAGWIYHHGMTPKRRKEIEALRYPVERQYDMKKHHLSKTTLKLLKRHGLDPKRMERLYDMPRVHRDDYYGYDGDLVRLVHKVPEPEGNNSDLIEVMIEMPQHQYDRLKKQMLEQDWRNIEITDSGMMIVRRGATDKATNIFISREE